MFSKTNIISTLATAAWAFFGGWIIWGLVADPFLEDHAGAATGVMREAPDMIHLILGSLIVGFIISNIYRKYADDDYSQTNGLTFGVWIGLLIGLGEGMVNFAVMDILDIIGTVINAVAYVLFYGIMGSLAGIVYSRMT